MSRDRWLVVLLVSALILSIGPHLPALDADFTLDDRSFVKHNASITSPDAAAAAFLSSFPPEDPARGLYRPMTALSYAADAWVLGDSPRSHHASSLLIYLVTVLLLYSFLAGFSAGRTAPLLGALLFSLHPVHCEVVDSISGRSELLALLFGLLALTSFRAATGRETPDRTKHLLLAGSVLSFALAVFSKETGLMVFPGIACTGLLLLDDRRRLWRLLLPYGLVAVLCGALRFVALEGSWVPSTTVLGEAAPWTQFNTMGAVFHEYARLLMIPRILSVDFYYQRVVGVHHALSWSSGLGIALLAAVILAWATTSLQALKTDRRGPPSAGATIALGLSLFLLFLLPVSHLVPFGALMAERFLYAPSLGLALVFVPLVDQAAARLTGSRRLALAGLAICMLIALGARTHSRAMEWRDPVTLWTPVEALIKDDYRIYTNLGAGYVERGDLTRAEQALSRGLELQPDHLPALNTLGKLYLERGEAERARATLRRVTELDPDNAIAWNGLGVVDTQVGRLQDARAKYLRALEANPNYKTARINLAVNLDVVQRSASFVEKHRPHLDEIEDPATLRKLSAACRNVGDLNCQTRAQARATP